VIPSDVTQPEESKNKRGEGLSYLIVEGKQLQEQIKIRAK